jgi:aldehyde dehydrogenase (NAD+)
MNMMTQIHPFLDGKAKRLLIAGEWVEAVSGKTFETINPSTGQVLARIAEGDVADVDRAVAAARAAFEGPWSKAKSFDRQAVLLKLADLVDKHFDELAALDTLDMGAPIGFSTAGRQFAVGTLRYYAGQAVSLHGDTLESSIPGEFFTYTLKEPLGVVAGIIPWNGPLHTAIMKIAPVLATGCTIVLKPAEQAQLTPLRLGELCLEAGVPPGVVNIVTGYGQTAGAALTNHPGVDKVSFTGSHITGQAIARAAAGNLKRVTFELGGKSPDVVFADADLDAAVRGAGWACFNNSGQSCSAGTRMFVERKIYEEFTARIAEYGRSLRVGDARDPQTDLGPLISTEQLHRVTSYFDIGKQEGARALTGGARLTEGALGQGYFVPPTVFANVNNDMRIAQEEIFGPVISAIPFDDIDDLLTMANRTIYGLGSGVWTRDLNKAQKMSRGIKAGNVWINCYNLLEPGVPFGGNKMSGYGRELGRQHVDDYLTVKSVWIKTG